MRRFDSYRWLAALLLGGRLASGGDQAPADAAAGTSGVVTCLGYVIVSTQTACRVIAVDDISVDDLGIAQAQGDGSDDTGESDLVRRALSGLDTGGSGLASIVPPPTVRLPRRQEGDAEDGTLGAALEPAREEDPFRSWGWLARDIGRTERSIEHAADVDRGRAGRDRWLSFGMDGSGGGDRRNPNALPSFDENE